MEKKGYDTQYQIILHSDTKKEFFRVCEKNAINPSQVVRNFIENFIKENK